MVRAINTGVLMRDIETTARQLFDEVSDIQWSITGEGAHRSIEVIDQPAHLVKLAVHVMQPKMVEETLPSHLVISVEAFVNPEAPMSPAHVAGLIRHLKAKLAHWVISGQSVSWHIHRRERAVRLSEPAHVELEQLAQVVKEGVTLIRSLIDESKEIAREEAEYFKAHALWGEAERAYRLWHLLDPEDQRVINALMKQLHSERRWGESVRFLNMASEKAAPERRAQLAFAAAVIAEECLGDHAGALSYLDKALGFDPNHSQARARNQRLQSAGLRPRELTRPVSPAPFPAIDESSEFSVVPSQVAPPQATEERPTEVEERADEAPALETPEEPSSTEELTSGEGLDLGELEVAPIEASELELSDGEAPEERAEEDPFSELLASESHMLSGLQTNAPSVRPAEELTTAPGSVALPDLGDDDLLEDFFEGLEEEPAALPSRPPVSEPSAFVEPPQPFETTREGDHSAEVEALDELEMDLGLLDLGELARDTQEDALSPDSIDEALTQLPPERFIQDEPLVEGGDEGSPDPALTEPEALGSDRPATNKREKKANSKGRKRNKKGKKKGKRR